MDRLCHPDGSLNSIAAQVRNQQRQLGKASAISFGAVTPL
jgi:hypothetical protein